MDMRRYFVFLAIMFFLITLCVSCCKNKDGNQGGSGNSEHEDVADVYYNVIYDDKVKALEYVDETFLKFGDDGQIAAMKDFIVGIVNNTTAQIIKSTGVQNVELGYRKVAYSYNTVGIDGSPVELSSVAFWRGYFVDDTIWHDMSPENICLLEHYTITDDYESPTQGYPLELLVTGNALTVMPDYIGYGLTSHMVHPYLNHDVCAQNSVDALPAGYQLFEDLSSVSVKSDWRLSVIGASQGGANALAVHKYMDSHSDFSSRWRFDYSFAAAGPHNPSLTIEKYFEDGKTAYPVALPFTLNSMFVSYPEILGKYDRNIMFSENYLQWKDCVDEMLADKEFTASEINNVFYENVRVTVDEGLADDEIYLVDIFSDLMFDEDSDFVKDLYKCLDKNDLTKGWTPSHSVKLFYSQGDRTVPFENSVAVYDAFGPDVVTFTETDETLDHFTACGLWMVKVLVEGL